MTQINTHIGLNHTPNTLAQTTKKHISHNKKQKLETDALLESLDNETSRRLKKLYANFSSAKSPLKTPFSNKSSSSMPTPEQEFAKKNKISGHSIGLKMGASNTLHQTQEALNGVKSKQQSILDDLPLDMKKELGPNPAFEDVVMALMMRIGQREETKIMDRIRTMERGNSSVYGIMRHRAGDLGGVAGGLLGGYFGGARGAVLGSELGDKVAGSLHGINSKESRQIAFEKLKYMMNKHNEMMSCISNILSNMHQTSRNTISNIKG